LFVSPTSDSFPKSLLDAYYSKWGKPTLAPDELAKLQLEIERNTGPTIHPRPHLKLIPNAPDMKGDAV
jgi:hypothetical protein